MVSPNNENVKLWMPMNEGTGTACVDTSGNNNHGVITGASWDTRANNGAHILDFDGSADYVTVGSNATIPSSGTIMFWCKLVSTDTFSWLMVDSGATGSYGYIQQSSNQFQFYAPGNNLIGNFGTIPLNTWAHYTITNNAGNYTLYLNGVSADTASTTNHGILTSSTATTFGGSASNSTNCRMSDVVLSTEIFTKSKVQAHMRQTWRE